MNKKRKQEVFQVLLPPTTKQFLSVLREITVTEGGKREQDIFRDFLEMGYCAYAKIMALYALDHNRAENLEARYMRIVNTYRNKDAVRMMPRLSAIAQVGVEHGMDFLGVVAAEIGSLDGYMGQYFTPMPLCKLMAQLLLSPKQIQSVLDGEDGYETFGEPACGAGATILAAHQVIKEANIVDPMTYMLVYAADVSPIAYWMCYLQFTWAGIPALVCQENTLSLERFDEAWTVHTVIFKQFHPTLFNKPSSMRRRQEMAEQQEFEQEEEMAGVLDDLLWHVKNGATRIKQSSMFGSLFGGE